jgi:hypothetical protein
MNPVKARQDDPQADSGLPDNVKAEAARHGAGDANAGLDKRDPKDVVSVVGAGGKLAAGQKAALFEVYSHSYDSIAKREDLVDAGSEMSFPASDPPSYMGGASVVGAPDSDAPREKANTNVSDPTDIKPAKDTLPPKGDKAERDASGGYNRPND